MNGEQQPDRGTEVDRRPDPHKAGRANRSWFKQLRHSVRDKLIYLRALPRLPSYELALRDAPSPLLIGATGGSGTRIITVVAQHAGWFMGNNLNASSDSRDTAPFIRTWIPHWVEAQRGSGDPRRQARMDRESVVALTRHRRGIPHPGAPWGVKDPKLALLLPYFHRRFPDLKFIHLVRDGRDMAFSSNQNQLRRYGHLLLDERLANAAQPVRSIALWSKVNLETAEYGERDLGERYLRIGYEEMCRDPIGQVRHIIRFLQAEAENVADAVATEIRAPASICRWRRQDPAMVESVIQEGRAALERFGYSD